MSKPKTPRGALRIITADERVRAILTTAGSADPDARVRASADLIERVNGLIKERDEARADGAMRTAERDAARARCDLLEQDRDRWKSRAERAERVVCDDDESDGTDCMHCGCPADDHEVDDEERRACRVCPGCTQYEMEDDDDGE